MIQPAGAEPRITRKLCLQRAMAARHRRTPPRELRTSAAVSAGFIPGLHAVRAPQHRRQPRSVATLSPDPVPGDSRARDSHQTPVRHVEAEAVVLSAPDVLHVEPSDLRPQRHPHRLSRLLVCAGLRIRDRIRAGGTVAQRHPSEAIEAIGAFVILNDFSARDVQREEMASGFGPQKSKHFASSMSATAVTADEILPRINDLRGSVAINGTAVSTVSRAGMQWSVGEVLAHSSRGEQLFPGEMFGTGTLPGGSGMEIGKWLQPGDMLSLTLDDIGEIQHTVTT
jgi:hypothetical protein